MPLQYQNPGAAFGSAIDEFMAQRAATKRQAMMDQLAIRKEADTHQAAMQALDEKKAEAKLRLDKAEHDDVLKKKADLAIGDVLPSEDIALFKKHGVDPPMMTTPQMTTPTAQPIPGIIPSMGAPTPSPTATPLPMRFMGTRPEQEKEQANKSRTEFATAHPDSPLSELALAQNAGITGGSTIINKENAAVGGEPVARQNPRTGTVERLVNGAWQPITGDVPKGTHFMTEPAPKDTSAAEARTAAHRDQVHQTAIVELDKWAKPIEDQIASLNTLGVSLSQTDNPKADALIAPELLKGTIAGGGVRITQPEINSVLGGSRTIWASLQVKLAKLSEGDSSIVLTPTERIQIRDLTKALRKKANDQHQKIVKARHAMDDAEDVQSLNKLRTNLQDELYASDAEAPAPKMSAADLLKKYGAK